MRVATTLSAISLAALLGGSDSAEARVETLQWTHPSPGGVSGFRVHWGTSSRLYPQVVEAGVPSQSGGLYSYDVVVPDGVTVYFAVTAHDGSTGLSSSFSNEQIRAAPGGGSGPGSGPLPGGGPEHPGSGSGSDDPGGAGEPPDPEDPASPDEEPLGAPGRPQVVAE